MSNNALLAIAIPVYNFERFLPETLDSVLSASEDYDVEVLVLDGCSTDRTQHLVQSYQKRHSNLRYVKALVKGGIDLDMAKCVELVSSRYCWLFSGDDVLLDDAVGRVLSIIENSAPDLLLCRHNECDLSMAVLTDWPVLDVAEDKFFQLDSVQSRTEYFAMALTSEAFFSFMGGLIIKREKWLSGKLTPELNGSCWAHISRLLSQVHSGFGLYYSHEVLLNRRGGNDSFSREGMLSRLKIQIEGLLGVVGTVFDSASSEIDSLKRVLNREVYPGWVAAVRSDLDSSNAPAEHYAELESVLKLIER